MLSRIARYGNWISAAMAASVVAASAAGQSDVRVAPAATQFVNPFAARRQANLEKSPAAPPEESGVPKTYQNPFAGRSASQPTTARRLHSGPLSRWQRPPQVLAAATQADQFRAAGGHAPRPDQEDLLGPLSAQERRATLFALPDDDETARTAPLPDPSHYGTTDLAQPTWLVPSHANSAAVKKDLAELPDSTPPVEHARAAAQPLVDPFEHPDVAEVVISDDASATDGTRPAVAAPLVRTLPPATSHDAGQWYAQAERAAADAATLDDLAAVVQICKRGLECRPERELAASLRGLAAWACNRSGELESDAHRDDKALNAFELAIQWDPNCWLALHNRAVSRAQQGELDGALGDFNRTLDLNPGLAVAYRNRGELLAALGRTEEAIADYDSALAQMPHDAELHDMRGHALHRFGRYDEAIADFGAAVRLAPEDAAPYAHRGNVYAEMGEYKKAIADFRQALSIDSESAEAHRSLAWLLATCPDQQYRNSREALAAAERAAKLAVPGDPFVLDALAAASASAGQFDRAVRYQQEAITNVSGNFAEPFTARLALYQQHRPYRNGSNRASDGNVRAASLEAPPRALRQQ
jgi:tetratricopeptide (TPR) repeat protein